MKLDSPSHVGRCPSARVLVRTLADDSRRASSAAENGFSLLSITSSSFLHQHEPRPLVVPPIRSSPPPNLDHTPTFACYLYPNAATSSAHSSLLSPAQLPHQRIVAAYGHRWPVFAGTVHLLRARHSDLRSSVLAARPPLCIACANLELCTAGVEYCEFFRRHVLLSTDGERVRRIGSLGRALCCRCGGWRSALAMHECTLCIVPRL